VAITGGEPLEQVDFLEHFLPQLSQKRKILLETAGVHHGALKKIVYGVDIISMDIKLPSSTGMHPWWREHENFLKIARQKETYVKVVVTGETEDRHVEKAAELVASIDREIPFILQPASPELQPALPRGRRGEPASPAPRFRIPPSPDQLSLWWGLVRRKLTRVQVLPQIHKQMGIH